MGGTFADAVCEGFETLADCDDECGGERGAVNPFAMQVLSLKAGVGGHLEEVGGQHRVLVRADAL